MAKPSSQMEDDFHELYDFLFRDATRINKSGKFVPKVSEKMQSISPMLGVMAMSMALIENEEAYRVGLSRMLFVAHATALQLTTLMTIDSMESVLDEADR